MNDRFENAIKITAAVVIESDLETASERDLVCLRPVCFRGFEVFFFIVIPPVSIPKCVRAIAEPLDFGILSATV